MTEVEALMQINDRLGSIHTALVCLLVIAFLILALRK